MRSVRRHNTTTLFRLALLLATLFTFASLLMAGALYVSVTRSVREQLHDDIRADALDLAALATHRGVEALRHEIIDRIETDTPLPRWYGLYSPDGRLLAGNLAGGVAAPGWSKRPLTLRNLPPGEAGRDHELVVLTLGVEGGDWLAVGRDRYYINALEDTFGRAFLLMMLLTVGVSLALGAWLGRRLLRRVGAMDAVAGAIIAGDLSRRMPASGSGDELDRIAHTLNLMLERIEALLGEVRRLGADIAHDLRTPLTRLRRRLEDARQRQPEGIELEATLERALGEVDELLAIFGALLRIARVESGEARSGFATLDLSLLLGELADTYGAVAEAEGRVLVTTLAAEVRVAGDRELLAQLFVNLIENAIRHTPAGARIELSLTVTGDRAHACVRDNGPGIPVEARDEVLLPFRRLDRSRHTPGSGLGLALVRAIAELHDATLGLADAGPGLEVCIGLARA
ncbi:MAG: HAMP domain-containing histidine kinase [Xanthomonadaceae bacterium]|nr:HAMP domain-containing histidine kinase [Xanthomonadaceae bacterium]MDE2177378.1 HAMP domain-containing histidine kinase [Xanthomonadaceae bacterium]MDE2245354.1 HAMP domain-containing histidine kinase [Xanthomonadaceae bacterium]